MKGSEAKVSPLTILLNVPGKQKKYRLLKNLYKEVIVSISVFIIFCIVVIVSILPHSENFFSLVIIL